MPKKNKLYQCPYELQCKCDLTLPCLGCETWAEHYREFNYGAQHTQPVIALLIDIREYIKRDTCQQGMGIYNRTNAVLAQLQANA